MIAENPSGELKVNATMLAISGTIPFVGLTLMALMNWEWLSIPVSQALLIYAGIIASFISGIHWTIALNKQSAERLLWRSNITALVAWLGAMQIMPFSSILLLLCFAYLLLLDYQLYQQKVIPNWFWRLRLQASSIVIIFLLVFAIFVVS